MPKGGFRPGAGRPPGSRNKLAALQRARVQKRFPLLLQRAFELIFAPLYEERVDWAVEKIKVKGVKEKVEKLVRKKQIFPGPNDATRNMLLIAIMPYMHPRMSPDPDEEESDNSMGEWPLDLDKLTTEEKQQMATATAILEPLYRKALLRSNGNGNGNGDNNGDELSASTVASEPDPADELPVQHRSRQSAKRGLPMPVSAKAWLVAAVERRRLSGNVSDRISDFTEDLHRAMVKAVERGEVKSAYKTSDAIERRLRDWQLWPVER